MWLILVDHLWCFVPISCHNRLVQSAQLIWVNIGLDWNARLVSGIKVPASLSFWTLRNEGIIILLVFWPRNHQNWTLFITFFWHIIVILNISETCHHLNILDAHVFFGCSLGAQSHVEVLIRVPWWQHFALFVSWSHFMNLLNFDIAPVWRHILLGLIYKLSYSFELKVFVISCFTVCYDEWRIYNWDIKFIVNIELLHFNLNLSLFKDIHQQECDNFLRFLIRISKLHKALSSLGFSFYRVIGHIVLMRGLLIVGDMLTWVMNSLRLSSRVISSWGLRRHVIFVMMIIIGRMWRIVNHNKGLSLLVSTIHIVKRDFWN